MPELAEVEIVKRGLEPLLGGVLLDLTVKRDDIYRVFDPVKSLDQLVNSKLVEIHRHGKYLLFVFSKPDVPTDEDLILLIHLGMTGKLVYIDSEDMSLSSMQDLIRHKHTHLVFHFDKGLLVFNDVRRFGKVRLFDRNLLYKTPLTLSNIGPDCLGPDLNPDYLYAQGQRHLALKMKSFLLDQSILAGLGNIYADEVLFEASIMPDRLASSLTMKDWTRVYKAIQILLIQSIHNGGTSFRDYKNARNESGNNQNFLHVYGRKGLPCHRCGRSLEASKIAGRTSVYCPHCQK